MRKIIIPAIAVIASFAAGGYFGRRTADRATLPQYHTDTIVRTRCVIDTVRISAPVPSASSVTTRFIPLVIEKRDTVFLPVEKKIYRDSSFYAEISGYQPSLDSIEIYRPTVVETRYVTTTSKLCCKKWGLGVSAGITATRRGVAPGITVGVTYMLSTW